MVAPFDGKRTGDEHAGTQFAHPSDALGGHGVRYAPGSVLSGKYRLDALLGEGGMGSVWRGSHLGLDLPIAVKLIRSDLDGAALRRRLQLEARSAAKLGHPSIVRVLDVDESELGDPFIVMELLEGETLSHMLQKGRLSGVRAVQLLLPIVDALAVAHARGIVHRDLKPDNLMIAAEDQRIVPKILDFGIAKLSDPRDTEPSVTEAGAVVGSPGYMSPEQARGRPDVDYRTDIWSLSVVLYEAVTGNAPFTGSNYHALLRAIVEDEPTPIAEQAAGDAELWEILKRGLAKDRLARYRSMADMGRALAAWLLSRGATEDACGVSVDSKWLGRSSNPTPASEMPATSGPARPALTLAGPAGALESDSRAPVAAPPKIDGRTNGLRALLIGCALAAALAFAVSQSAKRSTALSPAHAESAAHAASNAPLAQPKVVAEPVPPQRDVPSPGAAASSALTADEPHAESRASLVGHQKSALAATSAQKSVPAPVTSAQRARELNLLAPY